MAPPVALPQTRSPTGSWLVAATSRSQVASPTPSDQPANGHKASASVSDSRPARQDKKRMSLAFLTKGVITGDSQSDKENRKDEALTALPPHQQQRADDAASTTASTHSRSRSKDTSRSRLSLSFLRPSSPLEALPDFASSENVSATSRAASQKSRPETGKSEKSTDGGASRKGSVKKRLSFMSISKKRSESSVQGRGRMGEVLVEE